MKTSNAIPPHRRSIRLRGHDYSLPGVYYVTICTQGRELLFGKIVEGEMELEEAGQIVNRAWEILPQRFALASLDAFVVMPNHVHGIIQIVAPPITSGDARRGAACCALTPNQTKLRAQQAAPLRAATLGQIVRTFKSTSAIAVNRRLGRAGVPVWQRNYYERIVRNDKELETVRQYIAENPIRWASDRENPEAQLEDGADALWM